MIEPSSSVHVLQMPGILKGLAGGQLVCLAFVNARLSVSFKDLNRSHDTYPMLQPEAFIGDLAAHAISPGVHWVHCDGRLCGIRIIIEFSSLDGSLILGFFFAIELLNGLSRCGTKRWLPNCAIRHPLLFKRMKGL